MVTEDESISNREFARSPATATTAIASVWDSMLYPANGRQPSKLFSASAIAEPSEHTVVETP